MKRVLSHIFNVSAFSGKAITMSDLFRKKSLDRISSPEELNDYIRVTTPSVWLILVATVILLLGMLAWSIFGTVDKQNTDGSTTTMHPITFVTN